MRSMMSTKSNWLEFRTLTTLKCLSFVIKTFISCKVIVYILHTWAHGCSGFNRLLFFHFCISHLVNIAIIANGRGGLLKKCTLAFSHTFCHQSSEWRVYFESRSLGLVRKRGTGGMREGLRPNRAVLEEFVVWSFFCLDSIQVIELHSKEPFWGWSLTNSLLPSGESVLQNQGKTWREHMQKETREGDLKYGIHFEKSNMSLVSITM